MTPPRFHRLEVRDVVRETADAISVAFAIPDALAGAFRFRAGQYLTLRTTIAGEEVRRSYSICSGEADGEVRIAIKLVPDGVFSAWAHATLRPSVALDVMSPTGRFGIRDGALVHVGVAAGSGITPLLSIMRTVLARGRASRFFLFYGSRGTAEILFRGALEDLKDRHLGRLSVFHVLSQERQDVDALHGRLDRDRLELVLPRILGGAAVDAAYVCGPAGMSDAATAALAAFGVPGERVQVERFGSALAGRPATRPPLARTAARTTASVILDGARTELGVAEGEVVLDAAIRAGLDLPFSCRGGMCSTCRARVVEGAVEMALNYSLEPWELEAGYVLTCQARPTTAHVVVDYDQQ